MFGIAIFIITCRITPVAGTIRLQRYVNFLKHPKTFRLFFRIIRLFLKIIRLFFRIIRLFFKIIRLFLKIISLFLKIPRLGIFASSCCQCIYILLNLKKSDPYDPCGFFRLTTTGRMVVTWKTAKPLIINSSVTRVTFFPNSLSSVCCRLPLRPQFMGSWGCLAK